MTGEDRLPSPFFNSCPDPKQGMSVNKLRKYLDTLPDPLTGTKTLTPVLLSDSKGLYLGKNTFYLVWTNVLNSAVKIHETQPRV